MKLVFFFFYRYNVFLVTNNLLSKQKWICLKLWKQFFKVFENFFSRCVSHSTTLLAKVWIAASMLWKHFTRNCCAMSKHNCLGENPRGELIHCQRRVISCKLWRQGFQCFPWLSPSILSRKLAASYLARYCFLALKRMAYKPFFWRWSITRPKTFS